MAHLVESMAYVGATPWHGLGAELNPGDPIERWREAAGLNWQAVKAPVQFQAEGLQRHYVDPSNFVLYRSDSKELLSVVSGRYKPVQPAEVLDFYSDLTRAHGFVLQTAGVLANGKKIWALATTGLDTRVHGNDIVKCYLLLATSYDGSMATTARFTSVRVVCNNTLSLASAGKADVTVPHHTKFDADKVKFDLKIGDSWGSFSKLMDQLSEREVTPEETSEFLLSVYFNIADEDQLEKALSNNPLLNTKIERLTKRMTKILTEAPGAQLPSAKGTAWGLVNAVTFDVDYSTRSRSSDTRLNSAWFGAGDKQKQSAMAHAMQLLEVA